MQFSDIFKATSPTSSFEFFPPKTDKSEAHFARHVERLRTLAPSFATVTYGAGGSTRAKTARLAASIGETMNVPTAAHLTCVGHSTAELIDIIRDFADRGIDNIVALRGDPPRGATSFEPHAEGLKNAADLVRLIRAKFGDRFGIAVAGHPECHTEATGFASDIEYLKQKVDTGADLVISQLFFDNRYFYSFCERCEQAGITVPIIAGIMPILTQSGVLRMTKMCGTAIPAELMERLAHCDDDDAVAKVGRDWTSDQCLDLLSHEVRGLHFYTLNNSGATIEIFARLNAAQEK